MVPGKTNVAAAHAGSASQAAEHSSLVATTTILILLSVISTPPSAGPIAPATGAARTDTTKTIHPTTRNKRDLPFTTITSEIFLIANHFSRGYI